MDFVELRSCTSKVLRSVSGIFLSAILIIVPPYFIINNGATDMPLNKIMLFQIDKKIYYALRG